LTVSGFVDVALLRQEAHWFLKRTESELAVHPTRTPTAEMAMFDDSESSDEDYSPPSTDSSSSEFESSDMDVDLSSDEVPGGRSNTFPPSYRSLTMLVRGCAYLVLFQARSNSTESRSVSICIM